MARMKFLCDTERCIECNGCVTACFNENDIPWGISRRRVVTINDGVPGEQLRRQQRADQRCQHRMGIADFCHRRPAVGMEGRRSENEDRGIDQ